MLPHVKKMVIDENKEYILTNYKPAKKGERAKDSDHFTQYLDIDLKINPVKPVRKEIFNFKCKRSQETFKELTSKTNEFSKCFETNEPFSKQIDEWRKVLKSMCQLVFKKIRVRSKKQIKKINPKQAALINIRNRMVKKSSKMTINEWNSRNCNECGKRFPSEYDWKNHKEQHANNIKNKCNKRDEMFLTKSSINVHSRKHARVQQYECTFCGKIFKKRQQLMVHEKRHPEHLRRLKDIEKEIANIEAEENRNKIIKEFKNLSNNPENVNIKEVWKRLKKICPKFKPQLPIAKVNFMGKLVSEPTEIKELLRKEYVQRLRTRPVRPDLGDLEVRKNEIFRLQLKLANSIPTKPWNMKNLERALAELKNNKSRDHAGYVNEVFKDGCIGTDLKNSLLTMLNKVKHERIIPEFMKFTNLTTVPKKGSLTKLQNERGIFRVDVLRSILMKLIYHENYQEIDRNMSDSQMGGRKDKGCRFNLFIINGIIHDVLKSKNQKPVLLQIYDHSQMFDSMNLKFAISDMFEAGLKNGDLQLLYEGNKKIHMAVNTPDGPTQRNTIENCVLQGDTFGSLLASVQVDSIGKECAETEYGYKYQNILPIGMLGLVDDTICISEAGHKAKMMNAFFNVKTAEKTLQFGSKKCKTMIVGKNIEEIHRNKLSVDQWSVEHKKEKYSEETHLVESYIGKVEMEQCDEQKYLGFTISNVDNNMTNIRSVRNKSFGTIKTIFNKMKDLKLRKYYFECGMIFLNIMLRSSILYGSETYYNLKENELRALERIEENYMRQLVGTTKGCPIVQLYLELGHTPARFGIMKQRLYFLKTILEQEKSSLISKVFYLQLESKTKSNWAATCLNNLRDMKIAKSLKEITEMTTKSYKAMIKTKCNELAFQYLMNKRGTKGKEIQYLKLQMSQYFLPNNQLEIEEQKKVFELRNKMTNIPINYSKQNQNKIKCICGEYETMEHIYYCKQLNNLDTKEKYENIYGGNTRNMKMILKRFEQNMNRRNEHHQAILNCDPPSSVCYEFGNG